MTGVAPLRAASPASASCDRSAQHCPAPTTGADWSATNLYAGETQPRHVVISGYHPAEGFEAETAAERAALARSHSQVAHNAEAGSALYR